MEATLIAGPRLIRQAIERTERHIVDARRPHKVLRRDMKETVSYRSEERARLARLTALLTQQAGE